MRVKEEEEPLEVDSLAPVNLSHSRPLTEHISLLPQTTVNHHFFSVKTEDSGGKMPDSLQTGAKMADRCFLGLKIEDSLYSSSGKRENTFELKVKREDGGVSGAKMVGQLLSGAKMDLFKAKVPEQTFTGAKMRNSFVPGIETDRRVVSGLNSPLLSEFKTEDQLFFGAKTEDQFGAKMADQCLRAVLWQDMSVNLASTLLHQLSGKKTNKQKTPHVI